MYNPTMYSQHAKTSGTEIQNFKEMPLANYCSKRRNCLKTLNEVLGQSAFALWKTPVTSDQL